MNYALLLGLLLLIGLASTRVTRIFKLPNVTGYLVAGLLGALACLGIDALSGATGDDSLASQLMVLNTVVSTIALGFIALSIGQEFKLAKIKEYGGKLLFITFAQALLACILVIGFLLIVTFTTGLNPSIAICLGAIATATAPAATLMVVHQYKAKGPLVNILLPVVAFDDAIGLIVFSICVSISKMIAGGGSLDVINLIVVPLIEIVGSIAVGFLLGWLMHLVIKFFKSRNNHIMILITFTLLGVGICQALNLIKINGINMEFSSLLLCMMTGATYVNLAHDEQTEIVTRDIDLLDRWTPFLFTLFFVLSGAHLAVCLKEMFVGASTTVLLSTLLIFVVYLVARSAGKYFGARFGAKATHQPHTIQKYLGITLLPQAGVAIGMANQISGIAEFQKDNIGNIIVSVVLCATLVYELVGPLLTKWALNKAGEIPSEETKIEEKAK